VLTIVEFFAHLFLLFVYGFRMV